MSGGSSLKDTDFSNDTDLSGIDVHQHISACYIVRKKRKKRVYVYRMGTSAGFRYINECFRIIERQRKSSLFTLFTK